MKTTKKNAQRLIAKSKHKKVLCIDDTDSGDPDFTTPKGNIRRGQIYHVVGMCANGNGFVILGKPCYIPQGVTGWRVERFKVIA